MGNLPKRAFSSPLIKYANFENESFLNLIRLNKPYANGDAYAIHPAGLMFKTLDKAEAKFDQLVFSANWESKATMVSRTKNY